MNTFNETFDSYYVKEGVKPYDLLRSICKDINSILPFNYSISMIRVYVRKNDNLWLISATEFRWDRLITINKIGFDIRENKSEYYISLPTHDEIWFLKHIGEELYYFCCECSKRTSILIKFSPLKRKLSKMFAKSSLVILLNHRTILKRQKNFDEIKNDVIFVNKAINVMHFIRNRMSPLKNIIEYYKRKENLDGAIRKKMEERINQEVIQAEKDLTEIFNTANYLLDKSKNPFEEGETEPIKVSQLYIIVSEIIQMILDSTISPSQKLVDWEKNNDNQLMIKTNIKELKILVSDWVNNIKKYMCKYYYGYADIENDFLVFGFENDFSIKDMELVRQLEKDINSKSKDAVISGKKYGHGLFIIKNIAQLMDYEIKAEIKEKESVGKILVFYLKINMLNEKNINL